VYVVCLRRLIKDGEVFVVIRVDACGVDAYIFGRDPVYVESDESSLSGENPTYFGPLRSLAVIGSP